VILVVALLWQRRLKKWRISNSTFPQRRRGNKDRTFACHKWKMIESLNPTIADSCFTIQLCPVSSALCWLLGAE
jgi:hypothetical protein